MTNEERRRFLGLQNEAQRRASGEKMEADRRNGGQQMEADRKAIGTRMEVERRGGGERMEAERRAIGTRMEQERRGGGVRMEAERRESGQAMEAERRAGGQRMESERRGAASVVDDLNALIDSGAQPYSLPELAARGGLPAITGVGVWDPSTGRVGGGATGDLYELDYKKREYWPSFTRSSDGLFTVPNLKRLVLTGTNGAEVVVEFPDPDAPAPVPE